MKILFVSSEVVPFAKTGGLADVAGALPKAIRKLGHDIRVFMPLYRVIGNGNWELENVIPGIRQAKMPGSDLVVYFVENEHFSGRDELYVLNGKDYPDNYEAFLLFCQAALPLVKQIDWRPDVIHCNDWQSGPLVLYVREQRKTDPFFKRTALVYSVHNMAYQGDFPEKEFSNFAKTAFLNADVINAVSETYAGEIQTDEYGYGLQDVLRKRSQDVYGIVNGVDYEIWDPAADKNLVKRYSRMTLSLRNENKKALQKDMGLPVNESVPLLGIVSRLDIQKGFDILTDAVNDIMNLDCQMIILGTGDPKYHELLAEIKQKYSGRLGLKLGFDAVLARRIYAGSDMFLMPSKYEPCGLGQLISFKYGAIPIVRKTGGLADTVHDGTDGFVFEEYKAEALLLAIKRALEAFKDKAAWKKMQEKVMEYDYSWDASAKKYISLYLKALDKVI